MRHGSSFGEIAVSGDWRSSGGMQPYVPQNQAQEFAVLKMLEESSDDEDTRDIVKVSSRPAEVDAISDQDDASDDGDPGQEESLSPTVPHVRSAVGLPPRDKTQSSLEQFMAALTEVKAKRNRDGQPIQELFGLDSLSANVVSHVSPPENLSSRFSQAKKARAASIPIAEDPVYQNAKPIVLVKPRGGLQKHMTPQSLVPKCVTDFFPRTRSGRPKEDVTWFLH